MPPDLTPAHQHLSFMAPLDEARAARLVAFMVRHAHGTVADLGCGWAELLQRVLQQAPTLRGLGVDLNGPALAHGRALAQARGLDTRLALVEGPALAHLPPQLGGALCIGASQIWGPPVESLQPLAYAAALRGLRALLPRGAPLVYGEGVWAMPPTPAAVAPLAGRDDEFVPLSELLRTAREAGFLVRAAHQASLDEWDAFEAGYTERWVDWLARHPADHPEAPALRARLDAQQRGYHAGYRGVLGFAYLELLAE